MSVYYRHTKEIVESLQSYCYYSSIPVIAVECATARLSMQTGLISWTELGTNPEQGAKIRSGMYAMGLISWAASEGSMVSSVICDRWLTRKLAMFVGSTDSLES